MGLIWVTTNSANLEAAFSSPSHSSDYESMLIAQTFFYQLCPHQPKLELSLVGGDTTQ